MRMPVSPQHRSMRTRLAFPLVGLMIASLGCGLGSISPTATAQPTEPLVRPTQAEAATATQATRPLVKPTSASAPAEQPSPSGEALPLSPDKYAHSSGTFELNPPLGWTIDEGTTYASWTEEETGSSVKVFVNTTGYQLEADAFDAVVAANEENYFGKFFTDHQVLDRTVDNFGAKVVTQSLTDEGVAYRVASIYYQENDVIFEVDFWAAEAVADDYASTFNKIWQDMSVSASTASSAIGPYIDVYTFTDPAGLYSFDVPYLWRHELYTEANAVVDTFWSPDRLAYVENISYDDGTVITKSLSGAFALQLLHQFYAEDVKITEDKVQPDGSERLTWHSPSGGTSGMTFFETRGTTFLMLTLGSDDSLSSLYTPIFDNVIATYQVP